MAADSITPIKHDRKWRDRTGERFGALVALEAFEARTSPSRFPEYRVYRQMLDRCYLPSARNFRWYGAEA